MSAFLNEIRLNVSLWPVDHAIEHGVFNSSMAIVNDSGESFARLRFAPYRLACQKPICGLPKQAPFYTSHAQTL
jgi:hypothetical protein